ncbi:permease [Anaeromyces robustus]|uniref:Permease n=1 Tax=Anaeromyces robustus TaxID=1754192 RepID=A0A1Y1VSW7_9FUNG|nr:permease [Anaeromyces robustus]|eukprot:ORX64125.1 permease [Anaeromyces robustus]
MSKKSLEAIEEGSKPIEGTEEGNNIIKSTNFENEEDSKIVKIMNKVFKLEENDTNIKSEIIGGLTSFMSMAYIIALNPNILSNYGNGGNDLWNGIFLATCISSFIAMMVMGFLANKPFCLAPGMGLNSFMAIIIGNLVTMTTMSYLECFQAMLCVVLTEGIIFFILSIFNVRDEIVKSIPLGIRLGVTPSIGLLLLNIGFGSNIYIVNSNFEQFFIMRDFFGALTANYARDTMKDAYSTMVLSVLTLFIGLFAIVVLADKAIKSSVILGILVASVFNWAGQYIFLDANPFEAFSNTSFLPAFGDMYKTTFFRFNFDGIAEMGWFTAIVLIVTFCIIDMFDTIGTLVGTADRVGLVDENGNITKMREAFIADSIGTVVGAFTGTSTVTTFIESAAGIAAGGRTGFTAIICGICFFLCIFLAPIAAIIPPAATSSALIYVGILMMSGLKKIDFDDMSISIPVTIMLIAMPISGSIGHGIGLAMVSSTFIKVFTGNFNEVSLVTYIISILFLVKFFLVY